MQRTNQKGFTLMELMVVIVIVAILAAVAVPLYINYVKDAQRTEAKGSVGAIITAEQAYYQKNGGTAYADLAELKAAGQVDISEAELNWEFGVTPSGADGFKVTVRGIGKSTAGLYVNYTYSRTKPLDEPWDYAGPPQIL